MLPITKTDKEKRSKFQRFLFNGFADKNELKAAILANNPHMDADQRSLVDIEIDNLQALITTAHTDQSIIGSFVKVVDVQDYAFIGQWRFNQRRLSDSYRSNVSGETAIGEYTASI